MGRVWKREGGKDLLYGTARHSKAQQGTASHILLSGIRDCTNSYSEYTQTISRPLIASQATSITLKGPTLLAQGDRHRPHNSLLCQNSPSLRL